MAGPCFVRGVVLGTREGLGNGQSQPCSWGTEASGWEQEAEQAPERSGKRALGVRQSGAKLSSLAVRISARLLPLCVCFLIHNQAESLTSHKMFMSSKVSERMKILGTVLGTWKVLVDVAC